MSVDHVYIGLPAHLKDEILWVSREHRTNPLSHIEGGSDVVVEYHNGSVYGYDWIKRPSAYVYTAFSDTVGYTLADLRQLSEAEQLDLARSEIAYLYARKYAGADDFNSVGFVEVWNSESSTDLPWELLKSFDTERPLTSSKRVSRDSYNFDPGLDAFVDALNPTCSICGAPAVIDAPGVRYCSIHLGQVDDM